MKKITSIFVIFLFTFLVCITSMKAGACSIGPNFCLEDGGGGGSSKTLTIGDYGWNYYDDILQPYLTKTYTFRAPTSGWYNFRFRVINEYSYDVRVELYDSSQLVASGVWNELIKNSNGETEIYIYSGRTYTLKVYNNNYENDAIVQIFRNDDVTKEHPVKINTFPSSRSSSIHYTVDANKNRENDIDYYTFTNIGGAFDIYTIGDPNIMINIYDHNGNFVDYNMGNTGVVLDLGDVNYNKTYTITVYYAHGAGTGNYTLYINHIPESFFKIKSVVAADDKYFHWGFLSEMQNTYTYHYFRNVVDAVNYANSIETRQSESTIFDILELPDPVSFLLKIYTVASWDRDYYLKNAMNSVADRIKDLACEDYLNNNRPIYVIIREEEQYNTLTGSYSYAYFYEVGYWDGETQYHLHHDTIISNDYKFYN